MASRRLSVIVGSTLLAMTLATLDNLVLGAAMPTIVADLGGVDHISWVVTAYALATAVSTPVWGKFGDMYDRKLVFMLAIVVFLTGSALAGLSRDMTQLIAFRAVQGLGGGGLMVGALAVIGTVVPPREQGRYQGLIASMMGFTTVAGPIAGGFITDYLGWRWCFYINLPTGLLAVVLIWLALTVPPARTRPRVDIAGMALWAVAISAVVLVTAWGGSAYAWTAPPILGLAGTAVVTVVALFMVERLAAEPMLPPRLFANPNFARITAAGFGLGALMYSLLTFLPIFMQEAQNRGAANASLLLLPNSLTMMVSNIAIGRTITRTGRYKIFAVGGAFASAVSTLLLARMSPGTPLAYSWTAMVLAGAGIAGLMQTSILMTMSSAEKRDLGVASATATLARTTGGSVGVSLMGVLFAAQVSDELQRQGGPAYQRAVADGTGAVFLAATGVAVLTLIVAWTIREVPLGGLPAPEPVASVAGEATGEH
jgi:EmrB/QacA subfamily drug resistance transporter